MTRHLRSRHGEAHVREQSPGSPLGDVPLGALVRLCRRRTDRIDPDLRGKPGQLGARHERIVPVKAIRIHEDGGPDVLRYEDVEDPVPGPGEVLVALRAGGLNHLDVWVRKGLPSVPKPRILGADGAGVVAGLGDGVESFAMGDRVVINPGIPHGDRITVIGEHTDGTHCELKAIPATQLYPLHESLDFVQGAAFPLVFETAYRMLVTKASLREGEWVLIWGIGGGVALAAFEICRALGARTIVTSSSADKLARARDLGADVAVNHADDDVVQAVKDATGGRGVDVVVETVGEATWERSLAAAASEGRIVVCGATSGHSPPARLYRLWWKQLVVIGSTMGLPTDFEGAYELITSGRARIHVDSVFPLAEAARAHERLESGAQFGKVVLSIPE
jgi:NADPH:quinone reductase-like Zn-dependent oxidoreductase